MSTYSSYTSWEEKCQAIKTESAYKISKAILDELQLKYHPMEEDTFGILLDKYVDKFESEKHGQIEELLQRYGFNFNLAIRSAIYTLLGKLSERSANEIKAECHPGVLDIEKNKNIYSIHTKLGTIHVSEASKIFTQKQVSFIFERQLIGRCYIRTFEFLKQMPNDYRAVILSSPHYFDGKLYHAYAEGKNHIVDMAANAFYPTKEDATIPLAGDIIAKLSYEEILEEFDKIPEEYSFLKRRNDRDKIYCLAMYYAYQRDTRHL